MQLSYASVLVALLAVGEAITPPTYASYTRVWSSNFNGAAGSFPPSSEWNIKSTSAVFNNEFQTYKKSTNNLQITAAKTLQITPRRDSSAVGGWTSGRIESNYKFTPKAGRLTVIEAVLRVGGSPANKKQGIWPAFWLLGNSYRHGTKWPASGEIDIMENINGQKTAVGGLHCDVAPGGICNEPSGIVKTAPLPDNKFYRWRVEINRRSSNWREQYIQWKVGTKVFHKVTGAQLNSERVWKTLAQSDLFIILNVAVGGDWPGAPNSLTSSGTGTGMEVKYVAHYVSNS